MWEEQLNIIARGEASPEASMQKIEVHVDKYVAHMRAAAFGPMPDDVPMPPKPFDRRAKAGKAAAPFRKFRKAS